MDPELKDYLISRALEGIIVTDLEGNILQCNETAAGMLRFPVRGLIGQFVGIVFPPRSVSHLLPNLLHIARTGAGFDGDLMLQDARENDIMVRMSATSWPDPAPNRLLLRFLDSRETFRIITQLKESSQMASLGTLIRSMSHEILNPVAVIGGHTRRILEHLERGSKEQEWTRQIMNSVQRLEALIETVRTFLNLPGPNFEKTSLDAPLKASLGRIRDLAGEQGIRILETGGARDPRIFMDPGLLEKAFTAVLLNAVERMPSGGDLTVERDHDGGHLTVNIADSGPTLDSWQLEEDMSPIHVLGDHRTHLNLAIARRIVDEHGGGMEMGTPPEGGLKVRIRLPADRRALAREREM